jgi:DNA repair photolyase
MASLLFPQPGPEQTLVGIARLAAEGQALAEGHNVEFFTIENRSILTRCMSPRMPFTWMINPYRGCEFACKYCYARYTHEFMELRDAAEFERKIYVKQHAGWLLRQELRQVKPNEQIAIGTATDPYQPAERKFEITRSLLEEFSRHSGLKIGLVTKSDLVLRDLQLLKAIAQANELSVCVTVTTVNTELARALEPRAPRPDLRLRAVRTLVEAGIHAGVNCAPVLPGITDAPGDLEKLVEAAAQAEAAFVWSNPLFLKPCAQSVFMPFLEAKFPKLVPLYRERYARQAYLPAEYQKRIAALVRRYCEKHGIRRRRWSTAAGPMVKEVAGIERQMDLFRTLESAEQSPPRRGAVGEKHAKIKTKARLGP